MAKLILEKNYRRAKYLRLSDGIVKQIEVGQLKLDEKLPSVNRLAEEFGFSRETVFKALNHLSEKGIIKAVDKVGYFVIDVSPETDFRVFLMLDRFTSFKEDLSDALVSTLGERAKINIFFHNHNIDLFKSLIMQNFKNYTHFVITTYINESEMLYEVLDKIPPEKLIIIDKYEAILAKGYGMIFQDFENDLYNALSNNIDLVKKYTKLILITDENVPQGEFVSLGFTRFCKDYKCHGVVHTHLWQNHFEKGNLYILVDTYDRDLVEIVKLVRAKNWKLGEDIGIISYNDTPTKAVLDGGITVISTNFKEMGVKAAKMILTGKFSHIPNGTEVILRNSL